MPNHSRRPTIIDVARVAGVSPTTVSYVLAGPTERSTRISDETAARVRAAAVQLGYVANASARTLRRRRTDRVLFLAARITSTYSQIIARSLEDGLTKHGLALGVHIGSEPDQVRRAVTILDQRQADGLIVEASDEVVPELRQAAAAGHPIVAIGPASAEEAFDVIANDDTPAIKAAMRHVVQRGYRHVVLLSTRPHAPWEHRIQVAYRHLAAQGVADGDVTVVHCPHDRMGAYETTRALLPRLPRPVVVYTGADLSAIGVVWACQRLGIAIPGDVGIIGHGNTPETQISVPQVTSLGPTRIDFTKAADLMASRLKEPSRAGRHMTVPCRLYIRESS